MKTLVTGGGGFLGKAIIKLLLQQGDEVRSLARSRYPELERLGVEQVQADIADFSAASTALQGCDRVFHVAAKAGVWGEFQDYYRANVLGTQNLLTACREQAVTQLIYTSSPSVVFDGSDMEGLDESIPYPSRFHAFYPHTKADAEQRVLAANDATLATVALRPHLIWGPEDNHLVPRIIARGKAGTLRRIGRRNCLVDAVYIDNAAQAHLQAAAVLTSGSPVAGRAYFIANDEPQPLWQIINGILACADIAPVTRSVPPRLAYTVGWGLEQFYRMFHLSGEPRMTRFVARELATSHWFDLSAAKRDFNYQPKVSTAEGLQHLRAWLRENSDGH